VRPLASLARRGVGAFVVILDLDSFAPAAQDGDGRGAELAAVRHALSEYAIANVVMHAGDAPERVLVTKERVRA
jgi:hypothetical protein